MCTRDVLCVVLCVVLIIIIAHTVHTQRYKQYSGGSVEVAETTDGHWKAVSLLSS